VSANDKKILVVDDDVEIAKLMDTKLSAEGYQVFCESTGKDGVRSAKEHVPDLILMDIVLPDIDGADAVKLLQEDPRTTQIPVLLLSGIVLSKEDADGQANVTIAGRKYKALGKPFTDEELVSEVRQAIDK